MTTGSQYTSDDYRKLCRRFGITQSMGTVGDSYDAMAESIQVTDDGDGGADSDNGTGLRGIADRVVAVGGTMHLHSPPGAGTQFEVDLPCESS